MSQQANVLNKLKKKKVYAWLEGSWGKDEECIHETKPYVKLIINKLIHQVLMNA